MNYSTDEISLIQEANKVADLPPKIAEAKHLGALAEIDIPDPNKDVVSADDLQHRQFVTGEFWKKIPAFKNISTEEFLDTKWQNKNTIHKIAKLEEFLKDLTSQEFINDAVKGMDEAPMNLRLSPYILSLINWDDPYIDPLRIQFIPLGASREPDHPKLTLDSLSEQDDSPVPGLVHRYFDKALFLPLDVCPVYCRFCTRSYAIGSDTDTIDKVSFKPVPDNWNKAFAYIASRPEIEDIVISGGDAYMLVPDRIRQIGEVLLDIPHIRRLRFATKGPAVMPMKILTDTAWTDALVDMVDLGRSKSKEVVLHTHFNSANEITQITRDAMDLLFKRGVTVRNQSVLIRGVNDTAEEMIHLVRKLSYMNVQPYYVYQHDMVQGTEEMRTSVAQTEEVERAVRGVTAGFNTPLFVTDAPGGGGKRDVHSYDYYDRVTGISVYRSPSVDENKLYLYFDPISSLPEKGKKLWEDESLHDDLINNAIKASGFANLSPAL
ncbi:MAG: KamA family radical SAM protein [Cyclobacteriaceae bacterium]|nr:KamA family radical SAM protein [Cyclobacteriaceae bacterium]